MRLLTYSFLIVIFSPVVVFAETINTGNAYINTSVSTTVNDGSVHSSTEIHTESSGESSIKVNSHVESNNSYKKIEVNINGEKKIIESTEPEELKVTIGTKIVTPLPTHKLTLTPKPHSGVKQQGIDSWVKHLISDLYYKIFK